MWASQYLGKHVSVSNIAYLINYGRIANHAKDSKQNLIDPQELKLYYDRFDKKDTHDSLSFANFKEVETTKHIHRLHPYKGKFIPQLVEFFLDSHTDDIKTAQWFGEGDIVLDPFCGSGTTLAVANTFNMHALGVDISCFNATLSNAKVGQYNLEALTRVLEDLIDKVESLHEKSPIKEFENALDTHLQNFNNRHFPKDFKRKVVLGQVDERIYGAEKAKEFLGIYEELLQHFTIPLLDSAQTGFIEKWYVHPIRQELLFLKEEIDKRHEGMRDILYIVLSRTARSCRATTHADLATLKDPITTTYYCKKHGKICRPLFSLKKWFSHYAKDTLKRLKEFQALRSGCFSLCLQADACGVDLMAEVSKHNKDFAHLIDAQKIAGIFSSPPYVGLIDYHEQHAYAYELFSLKRQDHLEIGAMQAGQGKIAREQYMQGIANVLKNTKRFLKPNYNVFLVANDKFNLYPRIAELAGMRIAKCYHRPVINRSEKDTRGYQESIFHLKDHREC
ncbi:site-specific DNA-methyltransferase [Helicobacter gastrocanis]|uniref:site-specific DNA-methyltransferase n=1 Tax=Helicobacter gastrocanis TaxID=2849641 RepID=UPI0021A38E47|nr:site-specific DNA-methyltransferase [Helicobacter sp. NHP19-003]